MCGNDLEVMTMEYKVLRDELYKIYDIQLKILTIVGSGLGLLYGIAYHYNVLQYIIYLTPIILTPLGLKFQYNSMGAVYLSDYLKEELEEKLATLTTTTKWIGYQHYYDTKRRLWKDILFDGIPKWLIFIGIPMGLAFLYSCFENTNNDFDWLGWIYLIISLIILFGYCYLWYKENEKIKDETAKKKNESKCEKN